MNTPDWLLLAMSVSEVLLLFLIVVFFWRLRKSEAVLSKLRDKQEELLNKLRFNAQLEQELVHSFSERQEELAALDQALEIRANELRKLIKQAEDISSSPAIKRETVLKGYRRGKSTKELARATNMSVEEVELIIEQSGL